MPPKLSKQERRTRNQSLINACSQAYSPDKAITQEAITQQVKTCLKDGADPNATQKQEGFVIDTPLICAARNGHMGAVTKLLEAGAKVDKTNYLNQTALTVAFGAAHSDVAKQLIDAGADFYHIDNEGKIPVAHIPEDDHGNACRKVSSDTLHVRAARPEATERDKRFLKYSYQNSPYPNDFLSAVFEANRLEKKSKNGDEQWVKAWESVPQMNPMLVNKAVVPLVEAGLMKVCNLPPLSQAACPVTELGTTPYAMALNMASKNPEYTTLSQTICRAEQQQKKAAAGAAAHLYEGDEPATTAAPSQKGRLAAAIAEFGAWRKGYKSLPTASTYESGLPDDGIGGAPAPAIYEGDAPQPGSGRQSPIQKILDADKGADRDNSSREGGGGRHT